MVTELTSRSSPETIRAVLCLKSRLKPHAVENQEDELSDLNSQDEWGGERQCEKDKAHNGEEGEDDGGEEEISDEEESGDGECMVIVVMQWQMRK